MKKYSFIFLLFFALSLQAQQKITGKVVDKNNDPIPSANIYWQNTKLGTTSNFEGDFTLEKTTETNALIVSYLGFKTQKVTVTSNETLKIVLQEELSLDEVTLSKVKKSTTRSLYTATNTEVMGQKELLKAACCNISESFSTNPSIDVNFADAVTGNRQIKMLGLTSPYILMAEENIPAVRGASQAYGLSFIPGTWVESIQVTKGAGSVINGYESISGQINYELLKPATDIPFFTNLYAGADGRYELNAHFNNQYSEKLSSTLFAHGSTRNAKNDMNNDGFLDNPLGKQINLLNRWQYNDVENGIVSFLNLRYMKDDKQGGQMTFNPSTDPLGNVNWGSNVDTERMEVSNKTGYVFKDMPYQSIGFQNAIQYHNQQSYFGQRQYTISQKSYYSNLLFSSIINNTKNKFTTGLSLATDSYEEEIGKSVLTDFSRKDTSVGAFFEYTFDNNNNFSLVAGLRADSHNRVGNFITPRLHGCYNPWEGGAFKFSAGRGKRLANVFAENQHLFASSRSFILPTTQASNGFYGLEAETAWNYGVSYLQTFRLFNKDFDVALDYYRTDFTDKAVVDLDVSPQQVVFHNLNGESFASSLQLELNVELKKHLNLKTAYKYYDVQTDYIVGRLAQPLLSKSRFFANLAFETHILEKGQQWKFDATYNWLGKQRFPFTASNPIMAQKPNYAPAFATVNAQVTRTFSSVFEVYLGVENLTNYQQDNAIVSPDQPFGATFDSSMIYGPVFGAMYYAGLRFNIK